MVQHLDRREERVHIDMEDRAGLTHLPIHSNLPTFCLTRPSPNRYVSANCIGESGSSSAMIQRSSVTLMDVSRRARVSAMTASRVLNRAGSAHAAVAISDSTRQ